MIWVKFDEAAIVFALLTGLSAILLQLSTPYMNESAQLQYPAASFISLALLVAGQTNIIDLDLSAILICFVSVV